MAAVLQSDREERGLSARQLGLLFLAGVAVCAVFFAAGFLVGYNERASKTTPVTEQVTPSGPIPPTVNPPLNATSPPPRGAPGAKPSGAGLTEETIPAGQAPGGVAPPQSTASTGKESAAPAAPTEGAWVIQVVASTAPQGAEKTVNILKGLGFPAFAVPPETGGSSLYRVQVGPYPTHGEAEKVRAKLVEQGYRRPFIKH